jgi:lysophospholipase L1-like esterase
MRTTPTILPLAIASWLFSTAAHGCPKVSGLPDFNCDGSARVVVLGDSLVYGTGDKSNRGRGGYVLRAQNAFEGALVVNLGVPGLETQDLVANIKHSFSGRESSLIADELSLADLVVIDVGRNDFWNFKPLSASTRNLSRIKTSIESNLIERGGTSPLVVTAVLMLPNRGDQGPWVKELNLLIEKTNSSHFPADLRFDTVSKRLLGTDRLHPTSKGYGAIAAVLIKYLKSNYPLHARALREDGDNDGLYDLFEEERFGTDPTDADTDDDGIKDGSDPHPLTPEIPPSSTHN